MAETGTLHGFHALPIEIIEQIFDNCRHVFGRTESLQDTISKAEQTLRTRQYIRQVCKDWKNLVDKRPSMWTTILLQRNTDSLSRAKDDILRSSPLPLDVILLNKASNILDDFMDFLSGHHSRIEHLVVDLSYHPGIEGLLPTIDRVFGTAEVESNSIASGSEILEEHLELSDGEDSPETETDLQSWDEVSHSQDTETSEELQQYEEFGQDAELETEGDEEDAEEAEDADHAQSSDSDSTQFFWPESATFPSLRSFQAWTSIYNTDLSTRLHTPLLESLTLNGHVVDLLHNFEESTLTRITYLNLTYNNSRIGHRTLKLLGHCVNLRKLICYGGRAGSGTNDRVPDDFPPMTLPFLEEIHCDDHDYYSGVFWLGEYLNLPNLRRLSYQPLGTYWTRKMALEVARPVSSTLRELTLSGEMLVRSREGNLLPSYIQLRRLTVVDAWITPPAFGALYERDLAGIPYFPVLEELVLTGVKDINLVHVAQFLKTRKKLFTDSGWTSSIKVVFQGVQFDHARFDAILKPNFDIQVLP